MTLQSNGVALEIEGDSEVPQQQLFRSPAAMCDAKIRRCSSVLPPLCPCMSYRRVAWQTNPSTHMTVSRILVSLLNTRVTLLIPFLVSGWTVLATSISGAMELT